VLLVFKALRALLVQLDQPELLASLDQLDQLVSKEHKVPLDPQVLQVQQALKD
jgi:hypothetical protein